MWTVNNCTMRRHGHITIISILGVNILGIVLLPTIFAQIADNDDHETSSFLEEGQVDGDIPIVEGNGGTITFPVEDDVLLLNDDNFDHALVTKENLLLYFFAPWCGHCKTLTPEYAKAAAILNKDGASVQLAKVDATVHDKIASRYEVTGYPTLFFIKNGQKYDYDGPRDALGIVEYLKQRLDPNWKPPQSSVLTLTSDNFTDVVDTAKLILVKFYTQWCTHCKKLAPEYERASAQLKDIGIPLAKVDGATEVNLKHAHNVTAWPTLKIFRKGRAFEYKGPRDTRGIVKYMKEESIPASKECIGVQQLDNSFDKLAATVVGFFENGDEDLFDEYMATTYDLRGQYVFLHTFDKEVIAQLKASPGTVVVYKPEIFQSKYEKDKEEFSKSSGTSPEIAEFVQKSAIPLVGHRTRSNYINLYGRRPLVVVYYDVNFGLQYRKATQIVRNKILEVAKDHPNVLFAVADEETFLDELKELGLDDSGEDISVGYYAENGLKYPMEPEENFGPQVLKKFVEDVKNGKIKPLLKSQPIPKYNDDPVKVIVAKTFEDIVMKSGKNVLIEFYAPWCGHCKELEPEYNKLAKKFESYENLIIAKMDATTNDLMLPFKAEGYPSIYFVKAADPQNPISYDGSDRNINTLTKFIKQNLNDYVDDSSEEDEIHKDEL